LDGYDVSLATGTVGWERGVHRAVPTGPKHVKNTYASETPITDGERIYAYFGSVGLFVFDLAGSPIWSKEMAPVKMRSGHGHASSPALFDDRLVIVNDNDTQSFVAAFDRNRAGSCGRSSARKVRTGQHRSSGPTMARPK